ncbi:MAG: hypothetical protein Q8N36_02940 [bacterium]|nr:hypothetical protein [bacterium]
MRGIFRLPPPKSTKWFIYAAIGAVASAFIAMSGSLLVTGNTRDIGEFLSSLLAGTLFFAVYWGIAAVGGYFGAKLLPPLMLGGFIGATAVLLYIASQDFASWTGVAAVASFLQVLVLSVMVGLMAELITYFFFRNREDT